MILPNTPLTKQFRHMAHRRLAAAGFFLAFHLAAAADNAPIPLRIGSGEGSLQRYVECGYTAAILGDVTKLATFDTQSPGAIAVDSPLRLRIMREREKFRKKQAEAKKLGLAICLMTDEVSLPAPIAANMPRIAGQRAGQLRFDLDQEQFWVSYRAKYREVLNAWPNVAYVITRTGENYSSPESGYVGQTVMDRRIDDNYFRHMSRLIEETRKVVVDECGRTLIWRTWDLGNSGFHADPKVYDRVLAGLPRRKGLVFCIKHTQTDFWRYNDFNTTIGRGGVDQIVEFQCAREYEGKGAFPNYVGPIHSADFRKAAAAGVKGVWIWNSGGGWGGPELRSDLWLRANVHATNRLARDPSVSPRYLAEEWAAKEFGTAAAPAMAELLMLSSDCVLKSFYIAPYGRHHPGWKPSLNLLRDDIIRGEPITKLYQGSLKDLPEVYAEKAEAVAIAGRMRALVESARTDIVAARGEKVYQEAIAGVVHLQCLAEVLCHYVTGMFRYLDWQRTGDAATAAIARGDLLAWRAAWCRYQLDVPAYPAAASLYRSDNQTKNPTDASPAQGAMVELCEAALSDLSPKGSLPTSTTKFR